jgi:hypothetical protein
VFISSHESQAEASRVKNNKPNSVVSKTPGIGLLKKYLIIMSAHTSSVEKARIVPEINAAQSTMESNILCSLVINLFPAMNVSF